jgi:hypothetical protein
MFEEMEEWYDEHPPHLEKSRPRHGKSDET